MPEPEPQPEAPDQNHAADTDTSSDSQEDNFLTGISVDLQKYRIYLRRLGGVVSQHQGSLNNSFMTGQDASYGPLSSLNGFDLPAQSLAQLQGAGLARPVMVSKSGLPAD
ncbi:hypothetical protein F2Q68_00032468 [Brassica cretica]|uniref:Uncharacterized protein n=1 Tax=Brassica cretica TaxID=69181 RepID=A0A8S9GHQ7_BRACR|nr:hypothetical protein F2Q68_00032468 [Brassica cretica]